MKQKYIYYFYLPLILLNLFTLISATVNEVRCGSVDLRNTPKMLYLPRANTFKSRSAVIQYSDCTIIDGDVTVSMITEDSHSNDDYPVFENLREVTGSLLVYHVKWLYSLGKMFPNLRVIDGNSLIMNYALVIYQNPELRQVNLTKLTTIKNGGVRITDNSKLCYASNINWEKIMIGKVRDYIIDQAAGRCDTPCAVEDESVCEHDKNNKPICWNPTTCQKKCKNMPINLPRDNPGCTEAGEPCHPLCIGGCFEPNNPGTCYTCRHYEVEGVCVEKCPPNMFAMLNRRCLTREECIDIFPVIMPRVNNREERKPWKAFQGICHYECPSPYETDPDDPHNCVPCNGPCPKVCIGDTVDSVGTALKFARCKIIDGSLEIDMRVGMESAGGEKFTEAFGDIEEITGYLMIRFSTAFLSLHMFKNLKMIRGEKLWKNMYALVLFENHNLRHLFKQNGIELAKGRIIIQNNQMLCYKTIMTFVKESIMHENVSDGDVSSFTNGDKAICDEIPLEVELISVFSYGFVISWTPFNTTDMDHRKFLGYQIFYKKVEKIDYNMNIDDDRSACSDSWNMVFVADGHDSEAANGRDGEKRRGELIIHGVVANSLYAFYVQTRLVNHPGAQNAISKIHFVRTTFNVPDPPRNMFATALDANTLKLEWEPPLSENGVVTHYRFEWLMNQPVSPINEKLLCTISSQRHRLHLKQQHQLQKSTDNSFGTCPREQGCCKCEEKSSTVLPIPDNEKHSRMLEIEMEERAQFENTIQNTVFVQKARTKSKNATNTPSKSVTKLPRSRRRRELPTPSDDEEARRLLEMDGIFTYDKMDDELENATTTTTMSSIIDDMRLWDPFSQFAEDKLEKLRRDNPESTILYIGRSNWFNENDKDEVFTLETGKVNVTTMSVILTGLPHFTQYEINVLSCQDPNVTENYCASRSLWIAMKTQPIPEYDQVEAESVVLVNLTDGKPTDRKIFWKAPKLPNGIVLTYRVKLFRDDNSTPLEQCIPAAVFEANKGIFFSGLSPGHYSLEIRVESSAELLDNATIIKNLFEIPSPTFFTLRNILIMLAVCLLILMISTMLCFRYAAHQVEGKLGDIVTQNISNNPDYLSQYNFYVADDWELKREDIVLKEKIGRGTFGLVYQGEGEGIISNTGIHFGPCAVKTVNEDVQSRDRFLFLCEANVMKKFNTEFIIKLYGVVSNGTPVLVVMELMEQGNLRDYLRSLRPNSEENVDNSPPPTLDEYFKWAAQIADGMAYLEDQQFCHRDLAARNCMVRADKTVKIGDFGMTRDLYYQDYYKPAGKRMMPVRWMPPESLKDGIFSSRSDVWSYGIVLFEMITLGEQPYAGISNDDVFEGIVVHHKLPKINCHQFWYSMMRSCWQRDSRRRPLFQQIVNYLKSYASEEFRRLSYVINHMKRERICKEKYNFNQKFDDDEDRMVRGNDDYREHQLRATTTRLQMDAESEELIKEKQLDSEWKDSSRGWETSDVDGEGENGKLSITGRAMKKARKFGAPFIGRRRQNRLYNYKAGNLTVLETLFGFNPLVTKNHKRNDVNETVNAAYGRHAPTTPLNGNDYTRNTQQKDTQLKIEENEDEQEDEDVDDEVDDEDEQEDEEEDYDDESVSNVSSAVSEKQVERGLRKLPPRVASAHQPQCDYVETDPILRGADLISDNVPKRRSASMTSSTASTSSAQRSRTHEPV